MKKCLLYVPILTGAYSVILLSSCGAKTSNSTFYDSSVDSTETVVVEEPKVVYGVDLGLSVNWAECNVGADSPEDVGFCVPLGNITGTVKAPKATRKNVSGTDADIAVVKMGDGWRMPTGPEMQELLNKCSWVVETVNGHNGFKVTGPSGKSIFLPNTGSNYTTEQLSQMDFVHDTNSNIKYEGNYWCGTPAEDGIGCNELALRTDRGSARLMLCELFFCNAVRAVHEK